MAVRHEGDNLDERHQKEPNLIGCAPAVNVRVIDPLWTVLK